MFRNNQPRLFAYGTLNHASMQKYAWNETRQGQPATLTGWRAEPYEKINDRLLVAVQTNQAQDKIEGQVYELTQQLLDFTDIYEGPFYRRVKIRLDDGTKAWIYTSTH